MANRGSRQGDDQPKADRIFKRSDSGYTGWDAYIERSYWLEALTIPGISERLSDCCSDLGARETRRRTTNNDGTTTCRVNNTSDASEDILNEQGRMEREKRVVRVGWLEVTSR